MIKGPLHGVHIIEVAGIGAGPMAVMMLADMGADVIRIDRTTPSMMDNWPRPLDVAGRSRRSVAIDLRKPEGAALALDLIDRADGLVEAFRPGVAERLGIGPDICLARNPRLVYGRMTGWGQEGPLALRAGHDLNYIAVTGALAAIGRKDAPPTPPINLVGDGTGAMLMAFGMVCGLLEAQKSGQGQVVDAAMVDGASLVLAPYFAMLTTGRASVERGVNGGDGGAPYYDSYRTADGHYVAVGAMEPQFYQRLLDLLDLDADTIPDRDDRSTWPALKALFAERFATRTRAQWTMLMEGEDCCFAPVLTAPEALEHPHAVARNAYRHVKGVPQPAPAPRFSRSGTPEPICPPERGQDSDAIFEELGLSPDHVHALRDRGIVA